MKRILLSVLLLASIMFAQGGYSFYNPTFWQAATTANSIVYNTGKVGIGMGTNTLYYPLEVSGTIASTQILLGSGSSGAPSMAFQAEATLGFYRSSAKNVTLSNGALTIINTTANTAAFSVKNSRIQTLFDVDSAARVSIGVGGYLNCNYGDFYTAGATSASFIRNNSIGNGGLGLSSYAGQPLTFFTGRITGASFRDERMRIDSAGNVGIATTTPVYKLDVTGDARVRDSIRCGASTFYGTGTTWTVISDTSLKSNIQRITNYDLTKFADVHPISFNYKRSVYAQYDSLGNETNSEYVDRAIEQEQLGFSAQEFSKVTGKEKNSIDGNELMIAMWLKIQELETRIKALENK